MQHTVSEKAANMVGNRYNMVLVASLRSRELKAGFPSLLTNEPIYEDFVCTALSEIEEGLIGKEYLYKYSSKT